jgi:hypothetical protein
MQGAPGAARTRRRAVSGRPRPIPTVGAWRPLSSGLRRNTSPPAAEDAIPDGCWWHPRACAMWTSHLRTGPKSRYSSTRPGIPASCAPGHSRGQVAVGMRMSATGLTLASGTPPRCGATGCGRLTRRWDDPTRLWCFVRIRATMPLGRSPAEWVPGPEAFAARSRPPDRLRAATREHQREGLVLPANAGHGVGPSAHGDERMWRAPTGLTTPSMGQPPAVAGVLVESLL